MTLNRVVRLDAQLVAVQHVTQDSRGGSPEVQVLC
jgi:hypothetical protein